MNEKEVKKTEEVKNVGDILIYTKEIDRFVVDEDGNSIPCKTDAEAKILSLLLEIKKLLKGEKSG